MSIITTPIYSSSSTSRIPFSAGLFIHGFAAHGYRVLSFSSSLKAAPASSSSSPYSSRSEALPVR
jgi:hypothetical protein